MVAVQPEPWTGLRHRTSGSGISKLVEILKCAFRTQKIGRHTAYPLGSDARSFNICS
jgi:hypothetical protein